MLDLTPSRAVLHVDTTCTSSALVAPTRSAPGNLRTLTDQARGKRYIVCTACLLRGRNANTGAARWRSSLLAILHTNAAVPRLGPTPDRYCQDKVEAYALQMLDSSRVFSEDTARSYLGRSGHAGWYSPKLSAIHARAWAGGKALYDAMVARQVVTEHLDRIRLNRATALVAAGKGSQFIRPRTVRQLPAADLMTYAALLEGPRMGETEDWFITPATWPAGSSPTLETPRTFERVDVQHPDAYTVGLRLWDGHTGPGLADLIVGADHALTS